jgi:hypothetical protein
MNDSSDSNHCEPTRRGHQSSRDCRDINRRIPSAFSQQRTLLLALLVAVVSSMHGLHAEEPLCDRACLVALADQYLAALTAHDPSLAPIAPGAIQAQNQHRISNGEGLWKSAGSFAKIRQYVADTQTGQVGVQTILDEAGQQAIYAVRLKIVNHRITEAETLLTHDGEGGPPFEPEGFLIREAPYIRSVPETIRSSREQLLQTARTYWTLATTTHNAQGAPYMVDCVHFQNGVNTDWERELSPSEAAAPDRNAPEAYDGRIWTCARELTLTTQPWVKERAVRTLVDEERGLVMTWNLVDVAGRPGPDGKLPAPPKIGDPVPPLPANAPPGLSAIGWATRGQPQTLYHAEVMRIVGGKIQREQVFQRALAPNAESLY